MNTLLPPEQFSRLRTFIEKREQGDELTAEEQQECQEITQHWLDLISESDE